MRWCAALKPYGLEYRSFGPHQKFLAPGMGLHPAMGQEANGLVGREGTMPAASTIQRSPARVRGPAIPPDRRCTPSRATFGKLPGGKPEKADPRGLRGSMPPAAAAPDIVRRPTPEGCTRTRIRPSAKKPFWRKCCAQHRQATFLPVRPQIQRTGGQHVPLGF